MISIGISPCPNDTFIFGGLAVAAHRLSAAAELGDLRFVLADIDVLNGAAKAAQLDVVKVSFGVVHALGDRYVMLRTGGAMGRGCGPLVVTRRSRDHGAPEPQNAPARALARGTIAVPGLDTTAFLLLRLFMKSLDFKPEDARIVVKLFSDIPHAVSSGEADAGLLIHESRFTYEQRELACLQDLGQWWEQTTGLPIPLGCIVAKRSLGTKTIEALETAIAQSLAFAHAHRETVWSYVKQHSQELSDDVVEAHIRLYVNEFTAGFGPEAEAAIGRLLQMVRD